MIDTPNPGPDAGPAAGPAAWRGLDRVTSGADGATDHIAHLTTQAVDLIALTAEFGAPVAVRIDGARALSAAAARLTHAATALQVLAAGLVDAEGVHLADHERSTRQWLARHNGVSHRAASAMCRASVTIERFAQVREAYVEGAITLGHVDAIGGIIPARFTGERLERAVAAVADIQPALLEAAGRHSVDTFAEFCGRVRSRLDDDGTPDRAADPSRVWLSQTFDGRWSLRGDLTADDGALLATALLDAMARARSTASTASPEGGADTPPSVDDHRPFESERRAAALSSLVLSGAAARRPGRVGVYLHVDLDDLHSSDPPDLDRSLTDPMLPHTEAALDISVDTLWGLLADADITPVFTQTGRTLSFGRTHRLAPPILRRILAHRDRLCGAPGCDRPAIGNDSHHVVHWDDPDEGTTDPRNCKGFCKFHHGDHHRGGLGIRGDAEHGLEFTNADGTPFDASPAYLDRRRRHDDDLRADIVGRLPAASDAATAQRLESGGAGFGSPGSGEKPELSVLDGQDVDAGEQRTDVEQQIGDLGR